jgi:hypothetical protein
MLKKSPSSGGAVSRLEREVHTAGPARGPLLVYGDPQRLTYFGLGNYFLAFEGMLPQAKIVVVQELC